MIVITFQVPAGQQATGAYHDPEAPLAVETGAPYNSGRGLYNPLPVMIVNDRYFETDAGSLQQAIPLNISTLEPPENVELPEVSGFFVDGLELTTTVGKWNGANDVSVQWMRGGSPIEGAKGESYTPTGDDIGHSVYPSVTATNVAGKTTATGAGLEVMAATPEALYR